MSNQVENLAAVPRGVQMPAHSVQTAIKQAIAAGRINEDEGNVLFWFYSYGQEYHLSYAELGEKINADKSTVYHLFHGTYQAASWKNQIASIKHFQKVALEESKRKNIGFILTDTAKAIHLVCKAALNDGMPAFIYGASQLGKTSALLEFQRQNNHGRTKYLRMGSRWSKGRLVRELGHLFGNSKNVTRWELEDNIFGSLTRYNLLIIDEFHLALETTSESTGKEVMEFIREIYDRTGCGLVLAATKVGEAGLEQGRNKMLFDQLRRRGVLKLVLPDVPKIKDLNAIAKSFDLSVPTGEILANIKHLVKDRGLGVYIKYLQKAFAIATEKSQELTWDIFAAVCNGYAALSQSQNDY